MTRAEALESRIARLEEMVDLLMGKPRGPISLREYRLACERGERATIQRFLAQEESNHNHLNQSERRVTANKIVAGANQSTNH